MKRYSNLPSRPLIITLEMEEEQQHRFNLLRTQFFPSHANYLDAHITLFYKLPSHQPGIQAALEQFAQRPPLVLDVVQIKQAGNWVAYHLQSPALQALHLQMQEAFAPWLCKQDSKPLHPHITILNKTTEYKAKQVHQHLQQNFEPFSIPTTGFKTWLYMKGPWKAQHVYAFRS
ncbi:2'-5' RNA ligase superfamily protein [Filimonas lacunae]|uniref:2'-5' RNA ligase superfamily protein n=1 Tax=Filimonas lacunae TaxID=477680 RepID=A0A173MKZ3_9BACT|nr:2'-5' RNA ligase family protein [Filimonas lacunae]BAV08315.1 hypothetical protein FLA_4351 [Filimonas lacunae]SIT33344.1 2'-5' RNA ligase superfamily protein [Filimonas lacunae]